MKAKPEAKHNGNWKNAWLKTNDSITETEHNGNWKNAFLKSMKPKIETEHRTEFVLFYF